MQNKFEKALNRCFFYLKFRPRTEKEIYQYLFKISKKYRLGHKDRLEIIDELKEKKYLNDLKFIEWFTQKRTTSKPKAVFIIKSELRGFGIKEELINEYFEKNIIDEFELVKKAMEKARRRYSNLEFIKMREKIKTYLSRKGFRFDLINKAVEEMDKKD